MLVFGKIRLLLFCAFAGGRGLFAAGDGDVIEFPKPEEGDEGYAEEKVYTEAQKKAACKRYEGEYVGYYSQVYLVEGCKLREIQNHDLILKISRQKKKIHMVEANTVAQLGLGKPIVESVDMGEKVRGCEELESKYVTFSYTDVFLVKDCRKRPFPDWATYMDHRTKNGRHKEEVLALTWAEFSRIKQGRPLGSTVDEEFARSPVQQENVDVIPVDEACKGLNGRDVSYVDKIYHVEKCRKREYTDPGEFLKRHGGRPNLKELSSEQWISLPTGQPMNKKRGE